MNPEQHRTLIKEIENLEIMLIRAHPFIDDELIKNQVSEYLTEFYKRKESFLKL